MNLIFHIDVNSAYLSWSAMERLKKDPSLDLRTIPSIIGGDEKSRHGIVLAKSIPAKKFGITTGEPVVSALRKCPGLTIEPPNHRLYAKRSRELMELLHTYTSDIEQVSIDECYLDYAPIAYRFPSPQAGARTIADHIRNELGFTVNIGIAPNKLLAKMASDFRKPDMVHTLFPEEIPQKMWPLPVSELFMVGRSSAGRLHELGIRTIGELAKTNPSFLQQHFKSHGKMMWEYANGIDDSPLDADFHELKGIGNSTTLSADAKTAPEAKQILLALSEQVASRLRKSHQLAQTVTVEIKYNTFQSCSRQTQLPKPAATSGTLYACACRLFDELWNGVPIRLLGLRTTKLVPEDTPIQLSLFDVGLTAAEEPPSAVRPKMRMYSGSSSRQNAGSISGADTNHRQPGSGTGTNRGQPNSGAGTNGRQPDSGTNTPRRQPDSGTGTNRRQPDSGTGTDSEKQKRLEQAMDQIRRRFGEDAVMRGSLMKRPSDNSKIRPPDNNNLT